MQEKDKGVFFKVISEMSRGRVMGIGFLAVFLFLFMPASGAYAYVCTDCHGSSGPHGTGCQTSCAVSCHPNKLNNINHPSGGGTPLVGDLSSAEGITTVCKTCHVGPNTTHPYIINTDPIIITAGTDLDYACGQCHGGSGTAKAGVPQFSKAVLASYATDIHNSRPRASFGYQIATPDTLTVNVDASGSSCGSSCASYSWNWGDATPNGSGVTASHTYATGGAKTITLTVTNDLVSGSVSQVVNVVIPDLGPTVAGTCALDPNTWIETVTDTSTDIGGLSQVTVNWGDGGMLSSDTTAPFGPFTHTYLNAGTFTITHKAVDTIGQQDTKTCTASPAYFTISGTIYRSNGTTPVPSAIITVKKGLTTVKTMYSAANGTFSAGSLKPGDYTLTVTKSGYTFTAPAATITAGPSSSGNNINAVTP